LDFEKKMKDDLKKYELEVADFEAIMEERR
jgi:hypothetical protein